MRLLVDARRLEGHAARLAPAAAGLALRGHEVWWLSDDGVLPEECVVAPRGVGLSRLRVDAVLGGPVAPRGTALAGWRAGARCTVLALDRARVARWNVLDRWVWESPHASALLDPTEAEAFARDAIARDPERLALWSDEAIATAPDAAAMDTEILERACERALARQRGRSPRPAVFVDRDGTLVIERGYLSDPNDLELLPGVPRAIRLLQAAGYPVVVVSNQSGVGRGLFSLTRVYEAMARLRRELRREGIELDAVYFCPHRPEAGCGCRKPGIELLERAADDLVLSLRHSTMIGDKLLDAATGQNAGGRGLLVRTGYGRDEERRIGSDPTEARPDAVVEDLVAAAEWVLQNGDSGDAL